MLVLKAWKGLGEQLRLGFVCTWKEDRRGYWSEYCLVATEIPTFWKCQYDGTNAKDSNIHRVELAWACECSTCGAKPFGVQEIRSPRFGHWAVYSWSLSLLWSDCDCPRVLLSWSKSACHLLLFYRSPWLREFETSKIFQSFGETFEFHSYFGYFKVFELFRTIGL